VAEKKVVQKRENVIARFFRETIGELRKVSWPTWQEAKNLTLIVLIVILSMSVLLGSFDLLFSYLFSLLVRG